LEGLEMSAEFWLGRRVLVTGHTGFKGSWLCLWLTRLGASVTGLALAPEDDAAAFSVLAPWPDLESHLIDLRDRAAVEAVVGAVDPEVILHLGAQALVRRGYSDPLGTYASNVIGTLNLLHATQNARSLRAIVIVTSDKVYANGEAARAFREDDPLGGNDPYSSSKACTELAAAAWRTSFLKHRGVASATARAGNVIGGGDRGGDRLLPDLWRALESGEPVRLRYPRATRPWQFVLEPLHGYLLLAERLVTMPGEAPEMINFGPPPDACVPVAEVVERVLSLWGGGAWELEPSPQPPEAQALTLDATEAGRRLDWFPRLDLPTALEWTVEWWAGFRNGADIRKLATSQIEAYEELTG
jgi:CDP-glucose 4,6-dehydratase